MTQQALNLMNYMSDLSEEAYYAGWMWGLEYELYQAIAEGPRSYGRLDIDENHIAKLKSLSDLCGGWIVFDESTEETFVSMDEWLQTYQRWFLNR